MQGGEPLSVRSSAKRVKRSAGWNSDSVKCHLPIEYAADLTPVVAGRKLERVGMLAGWRMRLIFRVGRNTASGRQDGHPGRLPDTTKARHGGSISWCWAKQRGTS